MRIQNVAADYTIPSNLSQFACANGLYIEVDTTAAVNITLPPVGTYPKIIILDKTGNAAAMPITITAALAIDGEVEVDETVEGAATATIDKDNGSSVYVQASDTAYDELGLSGAVAVGTPKTIFLDIEAVDIIGAGSYTLKELLPDISPNYYTGEVSFEFTPGAAPFITDGGHLLMSVGGGSVYVEIDQAHLSGAVAAFLTVPFMPPLPTEYVPAGGVDILKYTPITNDNTSIYLHLAQGNISAGNGKIRAKVTYTENAFPVVV